MQIDLNRFRAAFFTEAGEHLQSMEAALLQLESSPEDTELLNTIFRAAHSIKGASTTFGIEEVGKFTHVLESLLERLRDGVLTTTSELVELLLTSVDVIEALIANARDNAPLPANLEDVFAELKRANASDADQCRTSSADSDAILGSKSQSAGNNAFRINFYPSKEFFQFGQDPFLILRELTELGDDFKVEIDATRLPCITMMHADECYLSWNVEVHGVSDQQAIEDAFMFLDSGSQYSIVPLAEAKSSESEILTRDCRTSELAEPRELQASAGSPALPTATSGNESTNREPVNSQLAKKDPVPSPSAPARGTADNETVRVDRQRLDELINQIGELVIGASMVEQELQTVAEGRGLESMVALGKIVRDLQEMSLGLRMVPIAATFQKMNRVIRDVAKKLDKRINFVTEGDDTELDKTVVDQISDPLVHMVRNAADHGVETTEERIAAGKPAEGLVKLRAYQQGGNIYIELSDDGRGLNRQRILEKAQERGLVAADATLADSEICNLIFQPGFSTAKEVTDVSGRGVGMDVVRRNVEALQGSVSIKSIEGQGSTLTVRLPLTLAILDGLLVRLSGEVFVIPLLSVIESMCVRPEEIRNIVGIGEVITLRGEVVPLLRLHQLLHISPTAEDSELGLVVIVEDQGRRFALKVDELLGQQQVVIKNLETNYRKVPGVAGATILGDGRVALILDIFGVSNLVANEAQHIRDLKSMSVPKSICP